MILTNRYMGETTDDPAQKDEYKMVWATAAACPVKHDTAEACPTSYVTVAISILQGHIVDILCCRIEPGNRVFA